MTTKELRKMLDTAIDALNVKLTEVKDKCDIAFYEKSCDWRQLHIQVMYISGKLEALKIVKNTIDNIH